MRSFFRFITLHPLPVLALGALVGLVLGIFLLSIDRETSPDAFIPKGHPALALKNEVDERFNLPSPVVVGVIRDAPGGVFTPHTLKLIQDITRSIQHLPGIESTDVMSLATESGVLFDEDGAPGFHRLLTEIPQDRAGLDSVRDIILGYELYGGTLVAEDASAATILIRIRDDELADDLYRSLQEMLPDFATEDEQVVVAGEAAVRSHMGSAVSDDALRMNFVCPIAMALLIILAYRSLRGTILPLCVIGGGSAMALGLMSASNVPMYIVTNGIFVVIMALGMADSLHLMGQYYEEQFQPAGRSKQRLIVDACMALWYPVLVTSLTDVAGFFALYVVGEMPPIRYFGLFTCAGVMGALLYSYTVLPAGLMILPLRMSRAYLRRRGTSAEGHRVGGLGRFMGNVGVFVVRHRAAVLASAAVLMAAAVWGGLKLVVNDARILAFKDHHPIVQATRALNERFDGTSDMNIYVTADQEAAFLQPEVLRRIEQLEAFTETLPLVGGTHSPSGWVKRAHQKMHNEDTAFYRIPEDPADVQFYFDVLGDQESPMARSLHEVLDPTYTEANLIVRMKSSQYVHGRGVVEAVQDYLDRNFSDGSLTARLAGRVNLDYHWLHLIRSTHIKSVLFSLACVLLLTGLMFRSVFGGILCTVPVAAAVLVNYAIMGIGDIPLGVGTSMFASIAIGAGVNFPIHLLDRLRIEFRNPKTDRITNFRRTLTFTGRALFFTAFVVVLGFLLLVISEFRTLVRFGTLIGIGMATSYVISVTVLPALVAVSRPRFIVGQRDSVTTTEAGR